MKLSRRQLLKAAMATGGAAAGARALGPLGQALAAPEPAHFVHIFFNGGLNALFAGNADKFLTSGTFGVSNANIKQVGSGVFTDATTFGTFPQLALDHWAAIGVRHGNALHTTPQNLNSGGERAMIMDGADCFLNQLAFHMGGDSAFKAVYFGDRAPAYREQKAFNGVPLQRVSDLSDAIKAFSSGMLARIYKAFPEAFPDRAWVPQILDHLNKTGGRAVAEIASVLDSNDELDVLGEALKKTLRNRQLSSDLLIWMARERKGLAESVFGIDLGHAIDRLQGVLDEVVLLGPQFRQVHSGRRFEHVVVDLPQSGGVWSKLGNNSVRQLRRRRAKLFRDAASCPIEVDFILERHLHKAVAEHALATN